MPGRRLPGEFELIARYFAPLAKATPGAFGLNDDAAVAEPSPGCRHVLAIDTLIAGVHFLDDDEPDLVARKLLRVNLSDLAAMGAKPLSYLVALSLPRSTEAAWVEGFATGLAADQAEFGIGLLGGDTTATPGPLTVSLTVVGEVPADTEIRRATARPGDVIHVSGTIGDAALGLRALRGDLVGATVAESADLADRYRLPRPRLALGQALRGVATAAIDVSDGLVADIDHICAASVVAARIERARVPLSPPALAAVARDPTLVDSLLSGGDDYELVFTAPAEAGEAVARAAREGGVTVAAIGRIEIGSGVQVVDEAGRSVSVPQPGWRHF